jgi:hypothetical protein
LASGEENILRAALENGTAQPPAAQKPKTTIAPGSLERGKIGKVSMSRLLLGGNLIGGWLHSRDLTYVSSLAKSYNNEAKVFETLELAQECGIDTIQIDPACWDFLQNYNRGRSKKMQTMVCIGLAKNKATMESEIRRHVDLGATLLYSHGGVTDSYMMNGGSMDLIGLMVDLIKAQGLPAGVGGHSLNMPIACEKNKINADFYVKTFHMDKYWSATPQDRRKEYDWMRGNAADHNANFDNMWCNNPEETAAFMATVARPWVAFKVMAAGAIPPHRAIPHAFRNGADFVIAGMFDFQLEVDVKIAIDAVDNARSRTRPWRA